jgi:hypothetical protein
VAKIIVHMVQEDKGTRDLCDSYAKDAGEDVMVRAIELLDKMEMKNTPLEIKPVSKAGDCRTGSLSKITKKEIVKILGFEPNVKDDEFKVKYSWGFTVNGRRCGVWDYKGSHKDGLWSTYGPAQELAAVFGNRFEKS